MQSPDRKAGPFAIEFFTPWGSLETRVSGVGGRGPLPQSVQDRGYTYGRRGSGGDVDADYLCGRYTRTDDDVTVYRICYRDDRSGYQRGLGRNRLHAGLAEARAPRPQRWPRIQATPSRWYGASQAPRAAGTATTVTAGAGGGASPRSMSRTAASTAGSRAASGASPGVLRRALAPGAKMLRKSGAAGVSAAMLVFMVTVDGGSAPVRCAVIAFSPPRVGIQTPRAFAWRATPPRPPDLCARAEVLVDPQGQGPRGRFVPRDAARRSQQLVHAQGWRQHMGLKQEKKTALR